MSPTLRFATTVLLFLPLLAGLMIYAVVLLATPIPSGTNFPAVFLSALEGRSNLLSWIVRAMLGLQPSVVVYLLTGASAIMFYLSLHLLSRRLGTAQVIQLISYVVLLVFIAVNFAVFTGSLMLLLPSSIATLALALTLNGRTKTLTLAVPLVIVACLIQPLSGLIVGVATLLPLLTSLKEKFIVIAIKFVFPTAGLLGFVVGRAFIEPVTGPQPIPSFFQFQQEPVFYLLLIGASSIGFFLLWGKDRTLSIVTAAWIACSLFLAQDAVAALLFMSVPVSFLASFPLTQGLVGVASHASGAPAVEIDFQKAVAVALVAVFLISSASLTFSTSSAFLNSGRADYQSIAQASSFLAGKRSTLVAPAGVLPYLAVNSGATLPNVDTQTLSAWGETTFRLQNGYVRVDDWEPFSASRAPRVAIFDGVSYEPLLYVDDSLAQFTLRQGSTNFSDSPYGMAFLGYTWLNGSSLQTRFANQVLSINRTESVSGPKIVLSYQFQAHGGASVDNCSIVVFADWPFVIDSFSGQGGVFFAQVGGKNFGFQASPGAIASYEQQPRRIVVMKEFTLSSGAITVEIQSFDAQSSGLSPVAASIYDYFESSGNKYLVSDGGVPDRFSNLPASSQQALYIDDAYQSFGFVGRAGPGQQFLESPYKSTIIQDSVVSNQRTVQYQTRGLVISKYVSIIGNDTMAIQYSASCNYPYCSSIANATAYLWVPWSRFLINYSVVGSQVNLTLDSGQLSVDFSPMPSSITIENTPQPAVVAFYKGGASANLTYTITISSKTNLSVSFQDSSRPTLTGSDVQSVNMKAGDLQEVLQTGGFRIYRVAQG